MSRRQWLASVLIAYHLTALAVAAVPGSRNVPVLETVEPPEDALAGLAKPAFDQLARTLAAVQPVLYKALSPLRLLTRPYIATGVGDQSWNMFSSPFTDDQYIRLDFVVSASPRGESRLLRQLVLPEDDESHVRTTYRLRDKVLRNTLLRFKRGLGALERETDYTRAERVVEQEQLVRLFQPIARYVRTQLGPSLLVGERVSWTEVWYGVAPIPPRGQSLPEPLLASRLVTLSRYRDGPALVPTSSERDSLSRPRAIGATTREADILWTLIDVVP